MSRLRSPRGRFGFETYRHRLTGGRWFGCNHCGRTVAYDPECVKRHEYYHFYCYVKLYRREYAERLYGADVFAGDPWDQLQLEKPETRRRIGAAVKWG
jgi:hypothetical protein